MTNIQIFDFRFLCASVQIEIETIKEKLSRTGCNGLLTGFVTKPGKSWPNSLLFTGSIVFFNFNFTLF